MTDFTKFFENVHQVEQDLLCLECKGTGGVGERGLFCVTTTCPACKGTGKFHLTREPHDATVPPLEPDSLT